MRVADVYLLTFGFNPAFILPGAENAAYGVNRGAGIIRKLLAAERKVDVDAVLRPAAGYSFSLKTEMIAVIFPGPIYRRMASFPSLWSLMSLRRPLKTRKLYRPDHPGETRFPRT
jgi:hypothetical protein